MSELLIEWLIAVAIVTPPLLGIIAFVFEWGSKKRNDIDA